MPIFRYTGKSLRGDISAGEIEASDINSASAVLRKKSLIVTEIKPITEDRSGILGRFFNRITGKDVVVITRQLAVMIEAGLTLSEAIDILEDQQGNNRLKEVLSEISHDVKGGLAFNKALARHTDIFSPLYINLIRSGETSGKLDMVLTKMANTLEKNYEFKSRIRGAMIYPAIVITLMIVVMVIMLTFVIPKLTTLYQETTLELPLPTKILIALSNLFVNFWWIMAICAVTSYLFIKRWMQKPEGEKAVNKLILKLPVIGKLMANVSMTNFTRTFALLISAGVPLLEAINIVEDVIPSTMYKEALRSSYKGVERGLSFSAQLIALPIFPRIVGQMARVGEETGKIDEVFYKLADYFDSESDQMLKNLTVAIEPIILIILGIGVAFLVLSIILPIYKITTVI